MIYTFKKYSQELTLELNPLCTNQSIWKSSGLNQSRPFAVISRMSYLRRAWHHILVGAVAWVASTKRAITGLVIESSLFSIVTVLSVVWRQVGMARKGCHLVASFASLGLRHGMFGSAVLGGGKGRGGVVGGVLGGGHGHGWVVRGPQVGDTMVWGGQVGVLGGRRYVGRTHGLVRMPHKAMLRGS